ncbi:MAG: hypothetical protein A07HR67_02734 [uncultured archaeon A07HR67]|nr:MAG: hypothetical protein A07HR67_02734 [uncultured archaeon A07HR67]
MDKKDYGSSNRRKFLIGAGSVAAGGSALLGTAATTTFNLNDRAVSADVVTDSSGAVALTDTDDSDIISLNAPNSNVADNELEIDFSEGTGASGVNIGSKVTIGDTNTPSNDPAFTITNQTTDVVDIELQFEAGGSYSAKGSGSTLQFHVRNDNKSAQETLIADDGLNANSTTSINFQTSDSEGLDDGDKLDVAIEVNADNGSSGTGENLSGDLNITATQSP